MPVRELDTDRLLLRRWRDSDRAPFAAMNADSLVMEHFPALLTRAQSDGFVDRMEEAFDGHGFGMWAVEVVTTRKFIGVVGLLPVPFEAHFTPATEVGWRLAHQYWGHGYAPEAAGAALADVTERLGLREIVSFTTLNNDRSRRVMQKLGMTHDPVDDFDHPSLPEGHPMSRHVLYRLHVEPIASAGIRHAGT
jgi:RimJ/RimL family protein N-acetyltransferase